MSKRAETITIHQTNMSCIGPPGSCLDERPILKQTQTKLSPSQCTIEKGSYICGNHCQILVARTSSIFRLACNVDYRWRAVRIWVRR